MRVIKNIDGVSFSGDFDGLFASLKEAGYKVGKKPLESFLSGEKTEYLGFSVIEVEADDDTVNRDAAPLASTEIGTPENVPSVADKAAAYLADMPPEIRALLFPSAPDKSAFAPKPEGAKPRANGKVISSVPPRRALTPIRKSENGRPSKIFAGLSLLLEGADIAALEAANLSNDITDFVMRRVTKRGYGLTVSADGIIKLVFPEGVSSIATK